MKKTILLYICLALMFCITSGCSDQQNPSAEAEDIAVDVDIKEKMFIAQTNDIYLNTDEYMDKTIRYEGMYFSSVYQPTGEELSVVIRYGPGCCSDDGTAGFEVCWDDPDIVKPKNNDWVEAIGTLEEYEEEGNTYLRMRLQSLRVLFKRGAETVLQ